MKKIQIMMSVIAVTLCGVFVQAQQVVATNTNVAVPPLVNFSGTLTDANGKPMTGTVAVTFSLYSEQTGGAALWMERQNVQPDVHGHYTVMLGSTSSTGLPPDIFVAGEAHWLGVEVEGEAEQPRVLLVSVPYALKAGDAQTLGGLPASAFVLAAPATGSEATSVAAAPSISTSASVSSDTSSDVTTTGGTVGTIAAFSTATDIQNSLITQTGTSAINIGGKLNLPAMGTATSTVAFNSQPLDFVASEYDSSTSAAIAETFQWQAQPTSNDTSSPHATLNLLYGSGTNNPAQTGLRISSTGVITFATGQAFPGVPDLSGANTFTGNQTVDGTLSATSSTSDGIVGTTTGQNTNAGVYGASTNGAGIEGSSSTGVAGLFSTTPSGTLLKGTNNGVTEFTVDNGGNFTTNGGINAGSIVGTGPNATGVGVQGISNGASGYGVEGTSANVGVLGQGSYGVDGHGTLVGVKGVATASGGLSGLFQGGPVTVAGNNSAALIGDPGCGSGFSGIGLTNQLSGCANYTLIADTNGDTYLNSTSSGGIHFRNNNSGGNSNGDLATIDHSGNLTVSGTVHSGNAIASVSASNTTNASTGSCTTPLTAPDSNCLTPNMTLTVTTSGGPVLVMANIGGILPNDYGGPCAYANFYLVMDNQIIATQNLGIYGADAFILTATMMSLATPAAGEHTFQVQEADDAAQCSSGYYSPTLVSTNSDPGWPNPTRTLIVREF
jgi:hypothetical protein